MGTHRTVVCLGIVTAILTIVCVALAGVLIWREVFTDRETGERTDGFIYVNTTNLTEVRLKFPGYFLTPVERQALLRANPNNPQPIVNTSKVFQRCFTNGYCERITGKGGEGLRTATTTIPPTTTFNPDNIGRRRRRRRQVGGSAECMLDVFEEDDLTFHGCCISYPDLDDPPTLPTAEPGRTGDSTIVQLPGFRQYFEVQYCCQAQNCTGCQCAQTYYVTSAVVPKPGSGGVLFGTEWVRVPGCCKCLNTSPVVDTLE